MSSLSLRRMLLNRRRSQHPEEKYVTAFMLGALVVQVSTAVWGRGLQLVTVRFQSATSRRQ